MPQVKKIRAVLNVLILFAFAFTNETPAQVNLEWASRYKSNPGMEDKANDLAIDNQGNIYITGKIGSTNTYSDFITIKYNPEGSILWTSLYKGQFADEALKIAIDNFGNVYVAGFTYEPQTDYDFCIVKYNSSGIEQWISRYDGPNHFDEFPISLALDSEGNAFITGYNISLKMITVKFNTSGELQWVAEYLSGSYPNDISVDVFGNIFVTGVARDSSGGNDMITIKYSPAGVQLWANAYNSGYAYDASRSVVTDDSGNCYVTGFNIFDFVTIKYDKFGTVKWVSKYSYFGNSSSDVICIDHSRNVYIAGSIGIPSSMGIIKYNSNGVQQWISSYNATGILDDKANSLAIDSSENIYLSGYSQGIISIADYTTIKYDESGNQQWVAKYNYNNESDMASAIGIDQSNNLYVTGISALDIATVKFSQTVNITTLSNEIPSQYNLYQNYPNPFNAMTKIKYEILQKSTVVLKVYDILGNEVKTLVNKVQSAGSFEVNFNSEDFSSGVFYYRLEVPEFTETKKLIILK